MSVQEPQSLAVPVAPTLDVAALYAEHGAFLGRTIARLVGDGAHVDDLLQETFIVAFRKRASYDGQRAAARTWLYAIAANLCRRHRRGFSRLLRLRERLASHAAAVEHVDGPDAALDREQRRAQVRQVLQVLPFKQREAFVLFELEGLSGEAIAALLDVPVATVWTRLHHARKSFREHFARSSARMQQAEVRR